MDSNGQFEIGVRHQDGPVHCLDRYENTRCKGDLAYPMGTISAQAWGFLHSPCKECCVYAQSGDGILALMREPESSLEKL